MTTTSYIQRGATFEGDYSTGKATLSAMKPDIIADIVTFFNIAGYDYSYSLSSQSIGFDTVWATYKVVWAEEEPSKPVGIP